MGAFEPITNELHVLHADQKWRQMHENATVPDMFYLLHQHAGRTYVAFLILDHFSILAFHTTTPSAC